MAHRYNGTTPVQADSADNNRNLHPQELGQDSDILASTSLKNIDDKDTLLQNIGCLFGIRVDSNDGPQILARQVAKFAGDRNPVVREINELSTESITTKTERETNYIHHGWSIAAASTTNSWISPHAVPLGLLQREQRDAFFEPIRRLSLDGTYLAWNGPVFRNLVDLRLSRIGNAACPTIDQFVAILESSPALCTLWLRHMNLRVGSRLDSAPVKMKTLQILGLEHVEPQGLCLLLPLLAPQLELYVKFEAFPRELEVDEALTDLFARSKVGELHLSTYIHPAQLPRMLARLQHLRIFMWRGVNIGDNFFKAIASNTLIANSQSNVDDGTEGGISANAVSAHICPNLHTLDFQECSISAAALRELVINRAIPKLTIAGCDISVDGTRDDALRLMDDFEKCLNDAVPDLLLSENGLVVD
ncbi:unnamed protein product [Rhizoctonia solani]|uniref:Uncharacterized protein n=1 Tax=Rhizoctonia solani TaxID=456999 RepID=A0A8H3E3L6_9AGAM|nr:unnamed protein product [Rhizoctonia solani]